MNNYEFTLKFALPDATADPEIFLDSLVDAGCTDALVGIGVRGRIALDFTREGNDAFTTIQSAIDDVRSAIPGVKLIEASPDFVGLTEIADLLGVSRQYVRKLMVTNHDFPVPLHTGKSAIWHLSDFLKWYELQKERLVLATTKEVAEANHQINLAKEIGALEPQVRELLLV